MPSSQATSIIESAACPRSNITDSGAPARADRASRGRSPRPLRRGGRRTARPRPARARWARSRHTMNAQRCWFFELSARRPARRIRSRCVGLQRPVREPADDAARSGSRPRRRRSPSRQRRCPASSSAVASRVDRSMRLRRARRVPPGRASGSRPGWPSTAESRCLGRPGCARPGSPPRSAAASSGSSGPPSAVARNRATVAPIARRPRTATSAGRRRSRSVSTGRGIRVAGACRRARGRAGGPGGRPARPSSASPWASRIGPR